MMRLRIVAFTLLCSALLASPLAIARELGFDERVLAQHKIEAVYYSHQKDATWSFAEAVPREVLERKVLNYLEQSVLLEQYWNTAITGEMLRRELERIAADTRMPERLLELYEALGNDRFLIEECLARPTLVTRLTQQFYAYDARVHAPQRAVADELHELLLRGEFDPLSEHPQRHVVTFVPTGDDETTAGRIGAIAERREAFVLRVVLQSDPAEMRVADYVVRKRPWDRWWRENRTGLDARTVEAVSRGGLQLPDPGGLRGTDCLPDHTWDNASLDALPDPRSYHTSVWTGSVMIVWGGLAGSTSYGTGSRYDPTTDSWSATATLNAPTRRRDHTAVWTGTEMIVWGGYYNLGPTGGRYDPVADSWTATSTVGAPSERSDHTAVWTGSMMLVWGGGEQATAYNDGAAYHPGTDSWLPISTTNAPEQRFRQTAVWSGDRMLVWGGRSGSDYLNTGGIYDPGTNSWTPISTTSAPAGRFEHAAVWTGDRLVIWGGYSYPEGQHSSGGIYDPDSNSWQPTSSSGAPTSRTRHTAVWADDRMLIWGGGGCSGGTPLNSGSSYDPQTNSWQAMNTVNAPSIRCDHSAIWTGSRMVVWGGQAFDSATDTGGRYDPASDSWTPTDTGSAPESRYEHTAVWTGSRMIVWGGASGPAETDTGAAYDPTTDSWHPTSTLAAPASRRLHTAVWTGDEMVVWGGVACAGKCTFNDGGRYDPLTDTWTPTSMNNAPDARNWHTAVWAGDRMIVWGGYVYPTGMVNSGAAYRPHLDSWLTLPTGGAPSGRTHHSAVWTGDEMIVWGGWHGSGALGDGRRYSPSTNSWQTISQVNDPAARLDHAAVWADGRMIVWGGGDQTQLYVTGGRYDPATDSWQATSTVDAPSEYYAPNATATNRGMLVWGGATGGYYRPDIDRWTPTSVDGNPSPRSGPTVVWTGGSAIFWGGIGGGLLRSGGCYVIEQEADVDLDGLTVCAGDCNDADPAVFDFPSEIEDLIFTGKTTIVWSSDAPNSGVGTVYDVLTGPLSALPVGSGTSGVCLESDLAEATAELSETPRTGHGFFVLVRGDNSCGPGSYGWRSDATPRSSGRCP